MARSDDVIARAVRAAGVLAVVLGFIWGVYLLGDQSYYFLRFGEWIGVGALTYFGTLFGWEWALLPTSWLGLHSVLNKINAGVAIALIGIAVGLPLINFESE
ncbi:hypothetical protein [Diaphorobacter nitroreducens]